MGGKPSTNKELEISLGIRKGWSLTLHPLPRVMSTLVVVFLVAPTPTASMGFWIKPPGIRPFYKERTHALITFGGKADHHHHCYHHHQHHDQCLQKQAQWGCCGLTKGMPSTHAGTQVPLSQNSQKQKKSTENKISLQSSKEENVREEDVSEYAPSFPSHIQSGVWQRQGSSSKRHSRAIC